MQFWCTKVLFYISAGFCRPSYLKFKMATTMHHLPEAPLHKSVIFLGDRTTVIGADFHIGPNNRLLTLTFTLTLTCGAGQPSAVPWFRFCQGVPLRPPPPLNVQILLFLYTNFPQSRQVGPWWPLRKFWIRHCL